MTTYLEMLDDANVAQFFGTNSDAYAGYVDGYSTFPWLLAHYGSKKLMSISIHGNDADCLDMENGAASFGQGPGWYRRAKTRKLRTARPVMYCSSGNSATVIRTLAQGSVGRSSYFLWSAHTGAGEHVCGPHTCGYPQADATQWTFTYLGRPLDRSIVPAAFFGRSKPGPVPKPVLVAGDTGPAVKTLQQDLKDRGWNIKVDGDFGPVTLADVKQFQRKHGLAPDGAVGPLTWAALGRK